MFEVRRPGFAGPMGKWAEVFAKDNESAAVEYCKNNIHCYSADYHFISVEVRFKNDTSKSWTIDVSCCPQPMWYIDSEDHVIENINKEDNA